MHPPLSEGLVPLRDDGIGSLNASKVDSKKLIYSLNLIHDNLMKWFKEDNL